LTIICAFTALGQEWSTYLEDDAVKIEYSAINVFMDSTYGEKIIFRYTNKTSEPLKLKFIRKVRYVNESSTKRQRRKYRIRLESNQVIEADLNAEGTEESAFQLFLGWSSDPSRIDSFMIDKVNHI
jgi:hypothetical protein